MITIVDLNYSRNRLSLISEEMISAVREAIDAGKKVLVYHNRRGDSSAVLCKDCSFMMRCGRCDTPMTLHTTPTRRLLCHHCEEAAFVPEACPSCHSRQIIGIGHGTQKFESGMKSIFPEMKIVRIDSDQEYETRTDRKGIDHSDMIIATRMISSYGLGNVGCVIIPLFELEIAIPEFDIEEEMYLTMALNLKKGSDALIQTFTPQNRILQILTEGTYKEFLDSTLQERKMFNYPPYVDYAILTATSKSKAKVQELISKLVNKLQILDSEKRYTIHFDKEHFQRRDDHHIQKISIRGPELEKFLKGVSYEMVRNRELSIEWR